MPPAQRSLSRWSRAAIVLALLVLALGLLLAFFPWDWLRGPINRYVSDKTGRDFAITRRLEVRLGQPTAVVLDGVQIANPPWARERYLLQAQAVEFQVQLRPLLSGRVVLPSLRLRQPVLGLEVAPDGRRTWALDAQQSGRQRWPEIGALVVDQGRLRYVVPAKRMDVRAEFVLVPESSARLPLSFSAQGQWRGQALTAQGRTGGVLQFNTQRGAPFPLAFTAVAGRTRLQAQGQALQLAELEGLDMHVDLQGQDLQELNPLLGVALPASPAYRVRGQLNKRAARWSLQQMQATVGRSDLAGELRLDRTQAVPALTGRVASRLLDLRDLRPLLGASAHPPSNPRAAARRSARPGKALPATAFNFKAMDVMNADVHFSAARVAGAPRWPVESASAQIRLQHGALRLQSLTLGVAGGRMTGQLALDGRAIPAGLRLQLEGRALQLNRLFPTVQNNRSSLGQVSGKIDLAGRGNSTAQLLGSASGDVAFLLGAGRISNILLEFIGLDGAEIAKFLLGGDQVIRLRCGAAAFDVRQGLMNSRVILLDTVDTVVRGAGRINLADETLDLRLVPEPKDVSILSLRSPLHIGGTFTAPETGPDKGALAGRAGLAIALTAINPLLGLAATIETGPGQDASCSEVLKRAAEPRAGSSARTPR